MLQILLSGRGRIITHALSWSLIILAMFYLLSTVRPVGEAAARTAMNIIFPILVFYINGRVLINRFFEKKRYWEWALLSLGLWLGAAFVRTKVELMVFGATIFNDGKYPEDGGQNIFLAVSLIFFVLMLFSGLYQLLENRRELESLHAAAQISYLKAQINPHFLFNTLNNIYSAAVLQHPRTPDMVLRLSELLRYVTYEAQAEKVPVKKEADHIRSYIDLFQLKSEQELPIRFDLKGDLENKWVEPILLLPLVENALKHSDIEQNPNGFLHILLHCESNKLTFQVKNTFDASNQQKDGAGGVGLQNITQRLALKQDSHHFETNIKDHVFTAILILNL
jgi:hypothetical protein